MKTPLLRSCGRPLRSCRNLLFVKNLGHHISDKFFLRDKHVDIGVDLLHLFKQRLPSILAAMSAAIRAEPFSES